MKIIPSFSQNSPLVTQLGIAARLILLFIIAYLFISNLRFER